MNAEPRTSASNSGLLTGYKWLTIITALGILVQAILVSQGMFASHSNLIDGHAQFGNLVFLLVVIQTLLAFMIARSHAVSSTVVIVNVLQLILIFAQIGLGYASRKDTSLIAWHIPNGVLLMGTCTALAVLAWNRTVSASSREW